MDRIAEIKSQIEKICDSQNTKEEKLQQICNYLTLEFSYYNWVGFYFRNGNKEELKLSQFSGEPTDHKIIPFGLGICGQVAVNNKNFIVQDVNQQDNYLSCSQKVKSEIVVPIFVDEKNIGQIDIDSHTINAFSKEDEKLLEFICKKVSDFL